MKKNLVYLISALFCFSILITSCNDWLDVQPIDKSIEKNQFSTEAGVLSVLEGLYKGMATTTLYGGNLSQTTIDAMANRFFYESRSENASTTSAIVMYNFSQFNYTASSSEGTIQSIWSSMYNLAFRVNNYLNALEASSAPIAKDRKELITGEAYAIRAYLHFDLFRLFGPIYSNGNLDEEYIPYNTLIPENDHFEIDLIAYGNVTMRAYFEQLIKDIETAERLMKDNDPIVTDYATAVTQVLEDGASKHYQNRNRRLNYYAVRALKARVLQYQGKIDEAATIAQEILDIEDLVWTPSDVNTSVTNGYDYTYFYEVLFGLDNQAIYKNGTDYYQRTRGQENYSTTSRVYNTIYSLENDNRTTMLEKGVSITDAAGNLGFMETYRFRRYCYEYDDAYKYPAGNFFQVLIRKSELLYIVAESYIEKGNYGDAVELLNDLLDKRNVSLSYRLGGDNNTTLVNDKKSLIDFIRMEYYREFSSEGQVFFFSKRHALTDLLDGREGKIIDLDNPTKAYTFPIPKAEVNF